MEKEFIILDKNGTVCGRTMAENHQAALKKARSTFGGRNGDSFVKAEECHKPHVEDKASAKAQKNESDKEWDGKSNNNLG